MSGMDIVVLALVAIGAALAVRSVWKERKGGGCAGCSADCRQCSSRRGSDD